MNIHTCAIRSEPHVEIGLVIERDSAALVDRWCHRAVVEQPTAKRVHYEVLRNKLGPFLQAMGRSLQQAGNSDANQHCASAFEHGDQRWEQGWSIVELVRDYQLLQLVILEHLEATLDRPLQYREVMAVGVFVDDAVGASINKFVINRDEYIHRIERERAETLEEANRRKDEFMAVLGHELRNPLAPIENCLTTLQLLLVNSPAPVLEAIAVLDRQTRLLARLVDDLLDLARIGQGRFELRKSQVNLTEIIEQAVQVCESAMQRRNHTLTVRCAEEPLFLEADPSRLTQILVNLLNNAAKFTERGGQISLTADGDHDSILIRVCDNGIGIPPEMMSRVFDLFTQVDGSSRSAQEGLGIGLALVQRLTQLHGGTVTCHSKGVGHGSEFVVRLPAQVGPPRVAEPAFAPEQDVPATCDLLLVEDNADSRNALAALLRLKGYRVDVAENGAKAIATALAARPQAALIDIGLPDMDGHEVAKTLRHNLGEDLLLVALTGYSRANDFKQALEVGFNAYLIKPVNFQELRRVLARAAADRSQSSRLQTSDSKSDVV
jgi:signal transduction histidine kinase/ActR/RegA family two-component response regulator